MKRKDVEKRIRDDYEQTLPSSGVRFEALVSQVDFSQYEKKPRPFYRRPWAYALASFALIAVATGTTLGIVLGSKKYYGTGNAFFEGVYSFSAITNEYNVDKLPKPAATDKIIIGSEPIGGTYFALTEQQNGYDGYLSVSGALEEYGLVAAEGYQGGLTFSFHYDGIDFSANIYGSTNQKNVTCAIEAPSRSLTFVFAK
ncbi:MAG: hypothetical protein SPI58_03970 [Candidatus Enteromonas sp.]|nr:hypothetical protein [Candidatus Enteromonas sp.]